MSLASADLTADSMRIFLALDIDEVIRERIQRFMDGVKGFAPDARWVRPESLHITLKFIGEEPAPVVEQVKQTVAAIVAIPFPIAFRGYGFFPTPRAARVFWIGIHSGPELTQLANAIDDATARLGVPRETHAFTPHLTLARGGSGSGAPARQKRDKANSQFQKLQEKLAALSAPEFGNMTAQELFLYESRLSSSGSRYTKVARFSFSCTP
jgi:2'-5' RNA ligase